MSQLLIKFKKALLNTSNKINTSLEQLFINKKIDDDTLTQLKELLISADVGINIASNIVDNTKKKKYHKTVTIKEIKQLLITDIVKILDKQNNKFILNTSRKLNIVLMCGVNGNGKTTTIAKIASIYIKQGLKVAVAACDTFRAAAVLQLELWAKNIGATIYKGLENADPASVAYQAIANSINNNIDLLLIDTAGRLHNKKNLIDELAKIIRVIKKIDKSAPHHTLLVIDATTGQNAITQAEIFKKNADISGLVITKLDSTAKAGITLAITQRFNLPIYFVGIGEKIDDLKPFISNDFAYALIN